MAPTHFIYVQISVGTINDGFGDYCVVLPIENNRYGTGISNFYEMFLQSRACHLGLVGGDIWSISIVYVDQWCSQLECEVPVLLKKKAQHKERENLIIARSVDNRSISPSIYKICC